MGALREWGAVRGSRPAAVPEETTMMTDSPPRQAPQLVPGERRGDLLRPLAQALADAYDVDVEDVLDAPQATAGALLDAAQLAAETAVERAGGLDEGDPRAVLAVWLLQDAADAAHEGESDPTRLLSHEAVALQLMYRTLIASRTGIEQARG